ncbi:hypothetical protein P3C33_27745 [Mesorhizobium sp. P16.1]|uniref:hypothetical protein n=1 Tax=unclassified Mesorhizobium TaxID=325217 RepID=UPI0021A8A080|nr:MULTISPECIES: hypothetical protein [unclassified Mesorhizobium]MCT2580915.1 hypothetical protein [Mesorhizobium sp. P13.3]MDF3169946.1 hypothetical protein [Mesorhizobium sp. P16.1]MDF3181442.1 hypothetical protein [Mesorhizobium sp. P17.1]MDF3186905.1 hypothetical protein [Mesorhizobium sp. ICCV3110.1]
MDFRLISAALFSAAIVSGCVTAEQRTQIYSSAIAPSAGIKTAVINQIRESYFDPYSIRDAQISDVVTLLDTGYQAVCTRFNAKNRMGAYTGLQSASFRIKNGAVVSYLAQAPGCHEPSLRYRPFPELESL